jgi:ADP-ribose pyrophosphatase YjhB (NUDIX family)
VGGIIFSDDLKCVLLIRRGNEPAKGKWSVPGGLVEWGESLHDACHREILEETGIDSRLEGPVGILDRRLVNTDLETTNHYLIVDFWGFAEGGDASAASDADAVEWFPLAERNNAAREFTYGLWTMIARARKLATAEQIPEDWLLE